MSIINNIKAMLGFPDNDEVEAEKNSLSGSPSYINPFKKDNVQPTPPPVPMTTTAARKNVEEAISDEVVDKITSVLNTSLPEYARECIDRDAQASYVRGLIGSTLVDFLQQIKQEAGESVRQQWQKERMELAQKSAEATKQIADYKTKNEELRNRILSLDRQRTTLNDRITTLESRATAAEAEREQYQLECKSMMNKLKVAAVNDDSLQSIRQECDSLREENAGLQKELADFKAETERKSTESAAQILAAKADLAKKEARIAELSQSSTDDEKNAEIERLSVELDTVKNNAKTEAEALTARITALSQAAVDVETVRRQLADAIAENQELKSKPSSTADSAELEKVKNELAVRDNELASMRSTIQSQNDELYALHEKLNEAGDNSRVAELEELRARLEDVVERQSNELSQKQLQIDDLNNTKSEISAVYEQMKKELERNKKHYADKEQEFRQQIVALTDDLESARNEISQHKAEKKTRKKTEKKAVVSGGISAIDYTTEYTDWLMPTPPSDAIPIVAETPADDNVEDDEPGKSQHSNPNMPEQMELFS